jgi:hypothetical protein
MTFKAHVNDVPNKHSRVSGYAMGDRKYLGADERPTVGLEFWSGKDEETMELHHYSVVGLDPDYARTIAQQLLEMADHADGLT